MVKNKTKYEVAETINQIYESLSERGKIMVFTYSNAIRDKEIADMQTRQQAAKEPELVEQ